MNTPRPHNREYVVLTTGFRNIRLFGLWQFLGHIEATSFKIVEQKLRLNIYLFITVTIYSRAITVFSICFTVTKLCVFRVTQAYSILASFVGLRIAILISEREELLRYEQYLCIEAKVPRPCLAHGATPHSTHLPTCFSTHVNTVLQSAAACKNVIPCVLFEHTTRTEGTSCNKSFVSPFYGHFMTAFIQEDRCHSKKQHRCLHA